MNKLTVYRDPAGFSIPATMSALVLSGTGLENLAVRQVPVPKPGPNQLLARVDAAGVCTSILKILQQGAKHNYFNGWDPAQWPVILGDEGAVTLVAIGANLRDQYQLGQRYAIQPAVDVPPINHRERYHQNAAGMKKCAVGYTINGNLAQYILITEEILQGRCLMEIPNQNMPYFAVSMAEPISCVYSAQDRHFHLVKPDAFAPRSAQLGMLTGGVTLVIGAGAMGRMHVELAMRFKPRTLIVSDLLQARLDIVNQQLGPKAKQLGIQLLTITPAQLKAQVDQLTGGRGVDDIVMAVGVQKVQQEALGLLGFGGVANLFGGLPKGQHELVVDAIRVHYDEIKLVGSSGGAPSDMAATLQTIATGTIDPGNYVWGIGGLQHAPQVLQMIAQAKIDGKAILYPHANIPELRPVQHWSQDQEQTLLENQLVTP